MVKLTFLRGAPAGWNCFSVSNFKKRKYTVESKNLDPVKSEIVALGDLSSQQSLMTSLRIATQ